MIIYFIIHGIQSTAHENIFYSEERSFNMMLLFIKSFNYRNFLKMLVISGKVIPENKNISEQTTVA